MGKNMMKSLERRRRRAEAKDEATELVMKHWEGFCKKADTVMLYTLHKDFGFGAKRIERFYLNMIKNQIQMIEEFRSNANDDDTHYLVMADRLRRAGVDIDDLLNKADQVRMPECSYEQRQKLMQELLNNDDRKEN